ncbi:MAG: GcrA cell cycle regulator [Rhizobiaceae bacterium]|nr:GcrA cell cycle regulator [Rhizobiaceae bacterium]
MAWTDDRVARLAKLWAEGLSASQIAADLGGVTRNAVIGKVHRLGLSGRAKPAGKSNAASRRKPAARAAGGSGGGSGGGANYSRTRQTTRTVGNTVIKVDFEEDVAFRPKPVEDLVMPVSRELGLLQLTETTCKWPTGDPTMPGFSFCGHSTNDDKPYCEYHNKLAFQPPSERRRRR